jgi:hypothetical protein
MAKEKKEKSVVEVDNGRDEVLIVLKDEVVAHIQELRNLRENPSAIATDVHKNARIILSSYGKILQTRSHDRAINLAEKKFTQEYLLNA